MLKIRLQGTTNEMKWFIKILTRDKRFVISTPSEPQNIVGSNRYKKIYTEIFRDMEEYQRYISSKESKTTSRYFGSGKVFGIRNDK